MSRMTPAEFAENFRDDIQEVANRIRMMPDFPKPGIQFRDIGPLLLSDHGLNQANYLLSKLLKHDQGISSGHNLLIAGVEARGFIFGSALSQQMHCGFVMVRKKGKLPGKVISVSYGLEYGADAIEVQESENGYDGNVVVVDDVLATGGTAVAAVELMRKAGAHVTGCLFLIELSGLKGREKLKKLGVQVSSLIKY